MRICLIQIMDTINLTTSVSCIYPPCSGDSLTSTTWPETHLREKNEKKNSRFFKENFHPGVGHHSITVQRLCAYRRAV